ncbi:hypothetical protein Dimus_025255 [Dionaea muscipula]
MLSARWVTLQGGGCGFTRGGGESRPLSGDCHAQLLAALRCSPSGLACSSARRWASRPLLTEEPPPCRCSLSWRCSHGRPLFGARCSRPWKLLRCSPGEGPLLARAAARWERAAARRVIARREGSRACRRCVLDGATRERSVAHAVARHGDTAGCSHAASVASTKQASAAARYLVAVSDAVARCMISHCPLHGDWKAHSSTMLTALLLLTCMGLAQMLSWPHEWDGLRSIVAL